MKTKFSFLGVQPPSNLFVINGQALQVYLYNICQLPADVRIITRILRSDGEMKEISSPVIAVNGVDPTMLIIPLTECYILSCTVICDTAAIFPGHLFAVVNLMNSVNVSAFVIEQLIAGYCSPRTFPTYPTTPLRLSTEVLPIVSFVNIADPGAGNNASWVCPANLYCRVNSVLFEFSAAAGGVARRVWLQLLKGVVAAFMIEGTNTVAPGTSEEFQFVAGITPGMVGFQDRQVFPNIFQMYPGDTLLLDATTLAGGDTFIEIYVTMEQVIFV